MKSVWLLAPTIRPDADQVFKRWKDAGYHVAAFVNPIPNPGPDVTVRRSFLPANCDIIIDGHYQGYAKSVNRLWREVSGVADIIIAGSDDLLPCTERDAQQLANDFFARFPDGFGAMHLSKNDLSQGKSTDHLWMGATYARRINAGNGPCWKNYFHYFDDTEAGEVAEKLGVLWRRPDLGQKHEHWSLSSTQAPSHLTRAQSQWAISKLLFETRRNAGFPGHEPLPA